MKISCIVAFKLTRICLTKKRAKWSLEPKCTFFASEVWTLEDQAEKLHLQVLVLPEKDNSFWNYQGPRNSIISGEAAQVKERTRAGNFKKLL